MDDFKDIFEQIEGARVWRGNSLQSILKRFPKGGKGLYRHDELVSAYRELVGMGVFGVSKVVEERIRMKPTRTLSGVATVTVLMKPFACPGACVFCPNDVSMPKSYIASEPGAQRALANEFDPFRQVYNRVKALQNIGHSTDKVELIVLGGTCSFYPEEYQIWFVKRCFDALNSFGESCYNKDVDGVEGVTWEKLLEVQKRNELERCRNVGLVFETRPDYITEKEVIRLRRLGATKVQIGVQSLDDRVLELNRRGHTVQETKRAFELLRLAGFKIHAHWMPNLYGSTVERDIADFMKLWEEGFCPDELKIYPTSILPNTLLEKYFMEGKFHPYTKEELLDVFVGILPHTPRFCRLTRIVRDIPSNEIVEGNRLTNFRQVAEEEVRRQGKRIQDIRSREIRGEVVEWNDLELELIKYECTVSTEYFISYRTKVSDRICSFLRLSIPKKELSMKNFIKELRNCAIIREVHVYGSVVNIGDESSGESQHLGLGKRMIEVAEGIARENSYERLAVISAIGTKEYYRKRGFESVDMYMVKGVGESSS